MKQNTLKSLAAVTLILCMVLSMCSIAFAQTKAIISTTSSFERDSNTKGTASLSAVSSNPSTPYIISKMTLQEAPLGSSKYVDSDVDPKTKKVYSNAIAHVVSFTITTKKEYRVKLEVTDNTNGIDNTLVFYEYLK